MMKLFIRNLLLFLLPLVIAGTFVEYSLRKVPNDYKYKSAYLEKNAGEVEVLVLGNSHSLFGLNPEYLTAEGFNAAHVSQSLKYDYYLFSKFKDDFTKLKTVVLPISYFSLTFTLDGTEGAWRKKNYSIYYELDYPAPLKDRYEIMNVPFKKLSERLKEAWAIEGFTHRTVDDLGFSLNYSNVEQSDLEETGRVAAQRHTISAPDLFRENLGRLASIVKECKDKGVKVLLYTSPAWKSYRDNLDGVQLEEMVGAVSRVAVENPHVDYVSFLADERFKKEDFKDADHLNGEGAKKFTKILDGLLTGAGS